MWYKNPRRLRVDWLAGPNRVSRCRERAYRMPAGMPTTNTATMMMQ